MRMLVVGLILILVSLSVSAQSGRRIRKRAEQKPVTVKKDQYSESRSYRPVRIYPPNFRKKKRDSRKPARVPTPATPPPDEDVIRIESTLVTIPVSIYDKNGRYISDLREEEFKIFENGTEQEIAYFGRNDKPFTVVLLLDTSPSTEYRIRDIRRAAKAFVSELKVEDSVIVIEFDANTHVLTERTSDRAKIYEAIDEADFGGGTSLYDAVEYTLKKRLDNIKGRKAIVLFTDGVDTTSSKADYLENLEDAEESDTLIFPIYYNTFLDNRRGGVLGSPFPFPGGVLNRQPRGTRPEDYALGKQYLEDLAAYTGGRVFIPGKTPGGLRSAFEGIAEELRRQYNIGYYPAEEGKPGERKKIKVRVYRPALIVRARDSYIVGSYN